MTALRGKGIFFVPITLHVGYGTFAPIKTENIAEHKIHTEAFQVTAQAAEMIGEQKSRGKRIIAVGTTSARVLEYQAVKYGSVRPEEGRMRSFYQAGFFIPNDRRINHQLSFTQDHLALIGIGLCRREKILRGLPRGH